MRVSTKCHSSRSDSCRIRNKHHSHVNMHAMHNPIIFFHTADAVLTFSLLFLAFPPACISADVRHSSQLRLQHGSAAFGALLLPPREQHLHQGEHLFFRRGKHYRHFGQLHVAWIRLCSAPHAQGCLRPEGGWLAHGPPIIVSQCLMDTKSGSESLFHPIL